MSYNLDDHLLQLRAQLQQGKIMHKYSLQDDLLRRKGKLAVGPDENLRA